LLSHTNAHAILSALFKYLASLWLPELNSSAELTNRWSYTSALSVRLHGAHTDSFDLKQLAFVIGAVKVDMECVLLFVLRFIAKKLCTACSRTNNKIVP